MLSDTFAGALAAGNFDAKQALNALLGTRAPLIQADRIRPLGNVERVKDDDATITAASSEAFATEDGENTETGREGDIPALLARLQQHEQTIAEELQKISDASLRDIGRTAHDIEELEKQVSALKITASRVERRVETSEAIESLARLNTVKERMEAAKLTLKEAENWNTLSMEMDTIFSARDYRKAASRLSEAKRSLGLLANAPEYEERKQILSNLESRLISSATSSLVVALETEDYNEVPTVFSIFNAIGKEDEFFKQYFKSRKQSAVKEWTAFCDEWKQRGDLKRSSEAFVHWVPQFLDAVFLSMEKEGKRAGTIFADSFTASSALFQEVLKSLNPTFSTQLGQIVEVYREHCLQEIIRVFESCNKFARSFESLHEDRFLSLNEKMKTDRKPSIKPGGNAEPISWADCLFENFVSYQVDYAEYEKNYLLVKFQKSIQNNLKMSYVDRSTVIIEALSQIAFVLGESLGRCVIFTKGFALSGYIETIESFLTDVIKMIEMAIKLMRHDLGIDRTRSESLKERALDKCDWSAFQIALRVVSVCRKFSEDVPAFESTLKNTMLSIPDIEAMKKKDTPVIDTRKLGPDSVASEHGSAAPAKHQMQETPHESRFELSKSAAHLLKLSPLNSFSLQQFIQSFLIQDAPSAFGRPLARLQDLVRHSQKFVFDSIFAFISQNLALIPSMSVWKSAPPANSSPFNLAMPTFSLSPTQSITKVGENLLLLPQQLDLYSEEDSLSFSKQTIPFIQPQDLSDSTELDIEEEDDITFIWIMAICRGTMKEYKDGILSIKELSEHGRKQLSTDINYICNIFSALEVDTSTDLRRLLSLMELDNKELVDHFTLWKSKAAENQSELESIFGPVENAIPALVSKVLEMRSIKV